MNLIEVSLSLVSRLLMAGLNVAASCLNVIGWSTNHCIEDFNVDNHNDEAAGDKEFAISR